MENQIVNIKKNDVFSFRYNEEARKKHFGDIYHCFDGILVAKQRDDGTLYLQDTYWGGSDSRVIYIEDVNNKGTIEFICNLDEMESIKESEMVYFNDEDIVRLGIHKGYQTRILIKKGTERSKEKMIQSIKDKISESQSCIEWNKRCIETLNEKLEKLEQGDLSIYI